VFSQNMQKTFTEYISEKRMEKAKKLLKSTELPTSEIAAQVGYKDPHYFSFVFKRRRGAVRVNTAAVFKSFQGISVEETKIPCSWWRRTPAAQLPGASAGSGEKLCVPKWHR
ncbi:MAG: helix-turn-helix domain-containing protein, partial [Roseburia faecis]